MNGDPAPDIRHFTGDVILTRIDVNVGASFGQPWNELLDATAEQLRAATQKS